MKGMFIVIEAVKTTEKLRQSVKLYRWLKQNGYDSVLTSQYWSEGNVGCVLEKLLDGEKNPHMEALLFAADRADHLEKLIKPALEQGKIVVCDRYYHSSIAFQTASGLEENWIREINRHFIKPDIVIYLDGEINDSKKGIRIKNDSEIHKKAKEVYDKMAENGEIIKVTVNGNSDETFSEIKKIVSEKLRTRL